MGTGIKRQRWHSSFRMNVTTTIVLLYLCLHVLITSVSAIDSKSLDDVHIVRGLLEEKYSQKGDIDIGAIMIIKDQSQDRPAEACSSEYIEIPGAIEITEAVVFATDLVNKNPSLLPNITLGFVVESTCYGLGINIGTALSFLPPQHTTCNHTSCSLNSSLSSSDSKWFTHDVIGVLPPPLSSYTIPVSSLYSVANLPSIGYVVTSDDLSDKTKHPYFLRIVPPDMYQVLTILNFIQLNGWSYISLIYEDDSYGIGAYGKLHQHAGEYGICIATNHRMFSFIDYDEVVMDLLANSRARVVVVFVGSTMFRRIQQTVINHNATGHFIWIGGDSLHSYTGYMYKDHSGRVTHEPAIGTFLFDLYSQQIPSFTNHLRNLRVNTTKNPWVKDIWELLLNCSHDAGTCEPDANVFLNHHYQTGKDALLTIDAVLTFAHATHNLLSERCPDARGVDARACITGKVLLEYLRNTSFDGFNGHIEFDEKQNVQGKYVISQFVYDNDQSPTSTTNETNRPYWKPVGYFDLSTKTVTYFKEAISWSPFKSQDRIVPWTNDSLSIEIPESVCSRPCLVGEYKTEKKLSCCWECQRCRDNERLVAGNTSCEVCPEFMWPDPTYGFTTCIDIPLTYSAMEDTIPIVLTSLACVTLVLAILVFIAYVVFREERVIKASSKELSVIQLFAIFMGYATVILFQTKPDDIICTAIFFMFCMSFALLYSPLLVKTIRIYRIFSSGAKNEKPNFVSPRAMLFFSNLLIFFQVIPCVTTYIFFEPGTKKTQPIWSEKLVELSCDLTLPGLASFLGYNMILVCLCSIFAFKVRKLPDNFNESQFISMCVSTTLLIWLAFIPTYFTADREYVRVFLLSTALLLNHSVALVLLFFPKIYAAVFLPSDAGDFSNKRS